MTPRYGLRAAGPFIAGAGTGAATGAGIRFSKVGLGGDLPKRVVGLSTKPSSSPCPRPSRASKCTTPPRAKLGVDPTTQAVAMSITGRMRFMSATLPSEPAGVVLRIDSSGRLINKARGLCLSRDGVDSYGKGARHHMRNVVREGKRIDGHSRGEIGSRHHEHRDLAKT
jgi:hypothetical protein